jgi:hypothetical protein
VALLLPFKFIVANVTDSLDRAYNAACKTGSLELQANIAQTLYQHYKQNKAYGLAMDNYEIYLKCRDSISVQKNQREKTKKEYSYTYAKKAAADSIKTQQEAKIIETRSHNARIQRYFLFSGICIAILFALFMLNRFRIIRKQKNVIEDQRYDVQLQKEMVEEKQREIINSIHYARRIQKAILPSDNYIEKALRKRQ